MTLYNPKIYLRILFYYFVILLFSFGFFSVYLINTALGANSGLAGRVLLQVEEHGEAWYVSPDTLIRHYLGRPANAWLVMREQGIGITNANLNRIPLGGVNAGAEPINNSFARKNAGKIFLQVEKHGEAWYVNPVDYKRYYLGRPDEAWAIMRTFGLGISNEDLSNLTRGNSIIEVKEDVKIVEDVAVKEVKTYSPTHDLRLIEKTVQDKINQERARLGLSPLEWNEDLANVAREHSLNLANENKKFTGIGVSCDFPLIHHEGLDFGIYNSERLNNRGVYYFGKSGENIALMSAASILVRFEEDDPLEYTIDNCGIRRDNLDANYQNTLAKAEKGEDRVSIIEAEIITRANIFAKEEKLEIAEIEWYTEERVARDTVDGWLRSEGHRRNIIDTGFDEAGVGAAYVNGYVVVTQSFIKRVDCGYINGPCCEEKKFLPYCYVPFECVLNICSE